MTCAIYGDENDLLALDGWKRFAQLARRKKKLLRMAHQTKLQSFRLRPVYKFGVQLPRNHEHAMELDRINGNTFWRDAELRELGQIDEYSALRGMGIGWKPAEGYKKIRVHLVYDVKLTLDQKS